MRVYLIPQLITLLFIFPPIIFAQNPDLNKPAFAELQSINTLQHSFTHGTFKGLLRYSGQYRDSKLHVLQDSSTENIKTKKQQQYSALGGYLGYETAPFYHLSAGATYYTSQPFGNNPDSRKGLGGLYEENGEQESYSVFGELYFKYQIKGHLIKLGRQEIPDYRFVSLSDIRMSPITHEGLIYENTLSKNIQLDFAYITKMKERNAETFIDMARGARIKINNGSKPLIRGSYNPANFNNNNYHGEKKEMTMASLIYNTEHISIEGWNYYINDFINTIYLYSHYQFQAIDNYSLKLSAQYATQKDVGSQIAGNIDTWFYGLKLAFENRNWNYFIAYNEVAYNENSYDGGTLFVRWGTPQMFNSFQVQDSELAGTRSIGAGIQYQFAHNSLLPGINIRLRYGDYNMPDRLTQTDARQDRTETTLDINYAFEKDARLSGLSLDGLSMQLRIAYDDYKTSYDFDQYQQIHGYDFSSVTDDFIDVRLYLNYKFY